MAAFLHGQIAVTGSPQPLSAAPVACTAWILKAPASNVNAVMYGSASVTTTNGQYLDPGESFTYELGTRNGANTYQIRPSDVYVVGSGSDRISWAASP